MEAPPICNESKGVNADDQEKVHGEVRQLRPSTMVQRLLKTSKKVNPSSRKMAGTKGRRILPEDLVEKIVAMMPFPAIFKVQCLSKSWRAKFEAISLQDDEEKKQIAISFQKQVREWSNRWGSFYHLSDFGEYCFDRTFQNEIEFPSLSFLPGEWPFELNLADVSVKVKGPLIYRASYNMTEIVVANILTRKWKQLPPHPALRWQSPMEMIDETIMHSNATSVELVISETTPETYTLIVFCRYDYNSTFFAQIYDSKSETWSISRFDRQINHDSLYGPSAFLDGVFYFSPDYNVLELLAFNLEERTWKVFGWSTWIGFPSKIRTHRTQQVELLVCNGFLWMIWTDRSSIRVLRIDLESQRFEKVARFGYDKFKFLNIPASENKRMFFEINDCFRTLGRKLAYDPLKDEWSHVSTTNTRIMSSPMEETRDYVPKWHSVSFQPGLNPFMAP